MLKKKCKNCGKKIERKFNFCPFCGLDFKGNRQEEDFGMLGKDDFLGASRKNQGNEIKMPFGLNKIMGSLVKQLEKQMSEMNMDDLNKAGLPNNIKGFKIHISPGKSQIREISSMDRNIKENQIQKLEDSKISEKEVERRRQLPKVETESKLRRIGDNIIYEISVPGVKSNADVVIAKLEEGIEVRAYSRDKCYVKVIPLTVEVIGYSVKKEKLFVELKG